MPTPVPRPPTPPPAPDVVIPDAEAPAVRHHFPRPPSAGTAPALVEVVAQFLVTLWEASRAS